MLHLFGKHAIKDNNQNNKETDIIKLGKRKNKFKKELNIADMEDENEDIVKLIWNLSFDKYHF